MNLGAVPPLFDAADQRKLRAALMAADRENLKRGQDIRLISGERLFLTYESGIIAHAGGGQASAYQITKQLNHFGTVATAADSAKLPIAEAGLFHFIANVGAASLQLFGTTPDTINGVATATGVAIPAGKNALIFCPLAAKWFMILTA